MPRIYQTGSKPRAYVEFEWASRDWLEIQVGSIRDTLPAPMSARLHELLTANEVVRISGGVKADVRPFYAGMRYALTRIGEEFGVSFKIPNLAMRNIPPGVVF